MFAINEDQSIYVTRGDILFFTVSAMKDGAAYTFQQGDVVRMKVMQKKACEKVAFQKDFPIEEETESVEIVLTEAETKIGKVISKAVDYWYEIELNPETYPQTIIGYDDDGAKIFKLFPEGQDIDDEEEITEEDIPVVDEELDLTSARPVENRAIAQGFAKINKKLNTIIGSVTEDAEIIEARTDAEGNTYDTLGESIRGQVAAVKSEFEDGLESVNEKFENYFTQDEIEEVVSEFPTYTEMNRAIANSNHLSRVFANELPDVSDEQAVASVKNCIYMIPSDDASENNIYTEWMYNEIDNKWEIVGNTSVNMDNFYTKEETEEKIDKKLESFDGGVSSWNDLADKPFSKTTTTLMEWDGDVDGLESLDVDGTVFYKISDISLTKDEFIGCMGYGNNSGTLIEMEATEEDIVVYTDTLICFSYMLFIASEDTTFNGITFTTGLWYIDPSLASGVYLTKLTKEVVETLDEDFIPDSVKLPEVTEEDNEKVLQVVDGVWTAVAISNAEEGEY